MALSLPRHRTQEAASAEAAWSGRPTWATERGATCWTTAATVAGAFPGFARQGGLLAGSRVRVTERYLLVDEGRGHGFGLPLTAIQRLTIGAAGETGPRQRAALHILYHDGGSGRGFLIRPRADRFGWPRNRFDDALHAFRLAGLEPDLAGPVPPLLISWDEARQCRSENVIWSGRATAPADAIGLHRASADIWLTTRSLMWSAGPDRGIHRVPLDQVVDVAPAALADQGATPVLVVGYRVAGQARRDLVFIFDRNLEADRNARERGAILVGFRSRGIPPGATPGHDQPWRRDWWPPHPLSAPAVAAAPAAASTLRDHAPAAPTEPASFALALGRAFEAEALALLAEADSQARALLPTGAFPVPVTSLGAALAELEAAEATGLLSQAQAASRRATLSALSESGSRLRALVRLCQAGQISPERLEERRRALLDPLNDLLIPATQHPVSEPTLERAARAGDPYDSERVG